MKWNLLNVKGGTIIAWSGATFADILSSTQRSYSYNILVDQVHFDHDGRDTVALRFTERFDDGTPKSLRGPAADATATSR